VQRIGIKEIQERTYKKRDAWWTVLLVDPVAVRLVWLVAPYRWITPNRLSFTAFLMGLGAAACFAMGGRGWLIAGALVFHLSFIIDCMDGKIARLKDAGSIIGAWFDLIFDRIRVIACTVALTAGQFNRDGRVAWIWLAVAIISLDLFRYLNAAQTAKIKRTMRRQLNRARGIDPAEPVAVRPVPVRPVDPNRKLSTYVRIRNFLFRHRIRTHLISGVEYEMMIFIIGPLIGFVMPTAILAGVLLFLFEVLLVLRLMQRVRQHNRHVATLLADAPPPPAVIPRQAGAWEPENARTSV
jgi:phosphatidylglycerophosphate synthase